MDVEKLLDNSLTKVRFLKKDLEKIKKELKKALEGVEKDGKKQNN